MEMLAPRGPRDGRAAGGARPVRTTHRRSVWLLSLVVRELVLCLSTGGCCFSPSLTELGPAGACQLVPRVTWWRTEAARGIAELERALAG